MDDLHIFFKKNISILTLIVSKTTLKIVSMYPTSQKITYVFNNIS